MSVLIVTMPGDHHAHATRWAIERLGGTAKFIYPADLCDGARWTLDPTRTVLITQYRGQREDICLEDYRTVWMRRPQDLLPQDRLTDQVERAITEEDFSVLAGSVYSLLGRDRFTVNPRDRSRQAGLKPFQLAMASEAGFDLPRTLVSNSPEQILEFYEANGGDIVFKPFRSPMWRTERGARMVPTTRVSREILLNSDLAGAPGIFQQCVDKQVEVRATVMGRSVFAWEKRFVGRTDLDVDWRFMFKNAHHAPHDLPEAIENSCFALLDRLGLVFGCFDLVIDEAGRYLFLEVNAQGQWLWGDDVVPELYQLEGMAEFLLSGDPGYRWSRTKGVRLSDYPRDEFEQASRTERTQHHGHLMDFVHHRVSFRVDTRRRPETGINEATTEALRGF